MARVRARLRNRLWRASDRLCALAGAGSARGVTRPWVFEAGHQLGELGWKLRKTEGTMLMSGQGAASCHDGTCARTVLHSVPRECARVEENPRPTSVRAWDELYGKLQSAASMARAAGNAERERACLDVLHLMDMGAGDGPDREGPQGGHGEGSC